MRGCDWRSKARTFYSKGVPIFFSPPLVQLPLSLSVIPLLSIAKYVTVITVGTLVSIIATGLAAAALVARPQDPAGETAAPPAAGGANASPAIGTSTISTSAVVPRTSPVLKGALCAMAVFAVLRVDSLLIGASSLAALQFGKALPAKFRAVCPAIITCGALTAMAVCALGLLQGVQAPAALAAYKNAAGGIFGGTGIGDFLFLGAAPAIVALGFSLFEQRVLLRNNWLPILGGSSLTAVLSITLTALLTKLLRLEAEVCLNVYQSADPKA